MKQVLILAYYFPPFGLSGVQRILKFVKYLPEYGWQPTVVTTEPHAYLAFDDSLTRELEACNIEVWRTPTSGAFSTVKERRTVQLNAERVRKALNRISQMVYVPDNKAGWKKKVMQLLAQRDLSSFGAVLSTAPPFSSHLVALDIKQRYGLPLAADFRDNWVGNPWHYYWTPFHRRLHERQERRVIEGADALIATNPVTRSVWEKRYPGPELHKRMFVIEQGYDSDDFTGGGKEGDSPLGDEILHIVYTGIFYEERHPLPLYRVLHALKQRSPDVYASIRFSMVGYVQEEYREEARRLGVDDRFLYHGYVEHEESVAWLQKADVLWLIMGEKGEQYATVSPGKTFEYLGSRKPIFAMTGECYTKTVLERFSHTFIAAPSDIEKSVEILTRLVELKRRNQLPEAPLEEVEPYNRKLLTGELATILDGISR
jgi:glycosyltransferase involved in cell wall biosynthesis